MFFDEADALFGKRTDVKSSNDRYANQEVAFLLQRVEDYDGLVILASNLKENIDNAFARRFQSVIHFPMPSLQERMALWQNSFINMSVSEDVNWFEISEQFEIAGGAITNVLQHCAMAASQNDGQMVHKSDVVAGIRKEFAKEGRIL